MEIEEQLKAPFPADEIEWRVDRGQKTEKGNFVFVLAYVTNRAIQNRLDDVFGIMGWKNEFKEWKKESQLCGISVWNAPKNEWITKWDGADDSYTDPTKGGLSGAMKRAAVEWSIGRYLYNLSQYRLPLKDSGENWASVKIKHKGAEEHITGYWDTPILPSWALPVGAKSEKKPEKSTPSTITSPPEQLSGLPPLSGDSGKMTVDEKMSFLGKVKRLNPACPPDDIIKLATEFGEPGDIDSLILADKFIAKMVKYINAFADLERKSRR